MYAVLIQEGPGFERGERKGQNFSSSVVPR